LAIDDFSTTIAAVATPQGAGGLGVIRVSGPDALAVASRVFVPKSGAPLVDSAGYRAHFGRVADNGKVLDEAVCLVFRAPHSYTGEDVAELSLHGGMYLVQRVLGAVICAGARPAQAGEFTKRAFLNGRIGLSEAEAVMGLISAHGEQSAAAALNALDGALSREIHRAAGEVIAVSAQLAAWVDHPDDGIEDISAHTMREAFVNARGSLQNLLRTFGAGQAVTGGISAAIAGRPNVGKSTLMNLLTGFDRSIVTPFAGTTRDVVEETVLLGNVVLRLADTAGIRDTDDAVESIGVERAVKKLGRAALVLAVFDGSEALTADDLRLLEFCKAKPAVAVVNKCDLPRKLDLAPVAAAADELVEMTAASGAGLDLLRAAVERVCGTDRFDPAAAMLATERQRDCCARAVDLLGEAVDAIDCGVTLDAVAVCADLCIEALLELTGEKASDAVVNEVFARFCVGK